MSIHKPVLLQEVIENLNLKKGDIIFDGTLGGGGYSQKILKKILPQGKLIATDLDSEAIDNLLKNQVLTKKELVSTKFYCQNYSEIKDILRKEKIKEINGIVLDLGISSDQLAQSGSGISFQNLAEKLDMNLSSNTKRGERKLTASEILNEWSAENLADIIFYYGGEKAAKKISGAIVKKRLEKKFKIVSDLVELLENEIGKFYKNKKISCATKTFQALRITVNDEIGHLKKVLQDGLEVLKKDGRLVVVTFHSLEDKVVKKILREWEDNKIGKRINKKVIKPSLEEIEKNKRARSAKLRVFEKK